MRRIVFCAIICAMAFFVVSCGKGGKDSSDKNVPAPDTPMKITFESTRDGNFEVYTMNEDGTNVVRLTRSDGWSRYPAWSRDGKKILFSTNRDHQSRMSLYVMNADGSEQVNIADQKGSNLYGTWSPEGRIAFTATRGGSFDIWVMNADGSDSTNITKSEIHEEESAFSFDGKSIAFVVTDGRYSAIWTMDADGKNRKQLTEDGMNAYSPSWSPAGTKIVFCMGSGSNVQL